MLQNIGCLRRLFAKTTHNDKKMLREKKLGQEQTGQKKTIAKNTS